MLGGADSLGPQNKLTDLAQQSSNFVQQRGEGNKVYIRKDREGNFHVGSELIKKESNLGYKTLRDMRETVKSSSDHIDRLTPQQRKDIIKAAKEIKLGYEKKYQSTGGKFKEGLKTMVGMKTEKAKIKEEYKALKRELKNTEGPKERKLNLAEDNVIRDMVVNPEKIASKFAQLNRALDAATTKEELSRLKDVAKELNSKFQAAKPKDQFLEGTRIMMQGKSAKDEFEAAYQKLKDGINAKEREIEESQSDLEKLADAAEQKLGEGLEFLGRGLGAASEGVNSVASEVSTVFNGVKDWFTGAKSPTERRDDMREKYNLGRERQPTAEDLKIKEQEKAVRKAKTDEIRARNEARKEQLRKKAEGA